MALVECLALVQDGMTYAAVGGKAHQKSSKDAPIAVYLTERLEAAIGCSVGEYADCLGHEGCDGHVG